MQPTGSLAKSEAFRGALKCPREAKRFAPHKNKLDEVVWKFCKGRFF
jgi:hypothetical protein